MNSILELEKPAVSGRQKKNSRTVKDTAGPVQGSKTGKRVRLFFRCLFMVCLIKVGLLATLVLTPQPFLAAEKGREIAVAEAVLADAQDGSKPTFLPVARVDKPAETTALPKNMPAQQQATPKQYAGVAFAAEPLPVPAVRSMPSPVSADTLFKPDQATPGAPPPPAVAPIPNKDSAAIKQEELNRREQELLALQQQMEARVKELNELESKVGNMLQNATQTQDNKIGQLVDMYAAMKPKQAAAVLETLDDKIAVQVLANLKPRQAGEILSYMNPTRTAVLSELLTKMQLR